jgi:hypothetical protein
MAESSETSQTPLLKIVKLFVAELVHRQCMKTIVMRANSCRRPNEFPTSNFGLGFRSDFGLHFGLDYVLHTFISYAVNRIRYPTCVA